MAGAFLPAPQLTPSSLCRLLPALSHCCLEPPLTHRRSCLTTRTCGVHCCPLSPQLVQLVRRTEVTNILDQRSQLAHTQHCSQAFLVLKAGKLGNNATVFLAILLYSEISILVSSLPSSVSSSHCHCSSFRFALAINSALRSSSYKEQDTTI